MSIIRTHAPKTDIIKSKNVSFGKMPDMGRSHMSGEDSYLALLSGLCRMRCAVYEAGYTGEAPCKTLSNNLFTTNSPDYCDGNFTPPCF